MQGGQQQQKEDNMAMGRIGSIQQGQTTPYKPGFTEQYGSSIANTILMIGALKKRKWDKKLQQSLLEDASKPPAEGDFTSRLQELGPDASLSDIMSILPPDETPEAVGMIQKRQAEGRGSIIDIINPLAPYRGATTASEKEIMKGYKPGTALERLKKRVGLAKTIKGMIPEAKKPEVTKPTKATVSEVKYTRTKARFINAVKIAKNRKQADFITNPAQQEVATITNQAEAKQAATLAGLDPINDKEVRQAIERLPLGTIKTGFLGWGKGRERPSPYAIDQSTGTRVESFASEEAARRAGKKKGDKVYLKDIDSIVEFID